MGSFKDSLRTWFYGSGTKAIADNSNVCILDASGNPIGCDTIDRVAAYALNNNDVVDMGLPSGMLWAKKNVGALTETGSGYYFSWGNITGHSKGSGYNFDSTTYNSTPAASISANLTLAQDAAHANLGGLFRMPTTNDFAELCNSEYTEYIDASGNVISGTDKRTTVNNVKGLRIRSKANGNIVFLPAGGYYNGTSLVNDGAGGDYYSSSLHVTNNTALYFGFDANGIYQQNNISRYYGFSIRAVI